MQNQPSKRIPARERLLAAAETLFYEEGFNAVGIERVIEQAGVAKASLYDCFGSKDELIRAYLLIRHEARKARMAAAMEKFDLPRERLLAVFDSLGELFAQPTFRGCAFTKANAEAKPGSPVQSVCEDSRQWIRQLFSDLARDAGANEPDALGRQLVMIYDGASVSAHMDREPGAAVVARAAAAALLDAAIAPSNSSLAKSRARTGSDAPVQSRRPRAHSK